MRLLRPGDNFESHLAIRIARVKSGVVVRERRDDEVAACVAVLSLIHKAESYPYHWPRDTARWLTPRNVLRAWVAVGGAGEIAGHVMVRGDEVGESAKVSRLFVSPDCRGLGLGVRFLELARDWAVENGRGLDLEVDSERHAAIGLYERMGWRRTGGYVADWTTPEGEPVTLLRYALA
jgi:ribosomal-protein-alanine N-acetyltransferase